MGVKINRIKNDIEKLASFNANSPDESGITRLTYSKEEEQALNYLFKEMKSLNMEIHRDGLGNILAIYNPSKLKTPIILSGSHIDTVNNGGKYDGTLGVVSTLESIRVIDEENINLKNPIGLIIFLEEEGASFGSTLIGSKYFTGKYDVQDIKNHKNSKGKSMYEIALDKGFNPESKNDFIDNLEYKAMLEIHVEQSIVLERENLNVGIVDNIAGIKWLQVELEGEVNHAGSTPMNLRKDTLVSASQIINDINMIINNNSSNSIVGTVGKIINEPNVPNVIPGKVSFTIDLRDVKSESMETALEEIKNTIKNRSEENGVNYNIKLMGESNPIELSDSIKDIMKKEAKKLSYDYKVMNSGAVHDSALMGNLAEVGMIFVPSRDGKSHCPDEFTSYEDIERGGNLLLNTIVNLANN